MRTRLLFLFMLLPFFAACNVYHPLRNGVGFTETPVGTDGYQVAFVGGANMSATEARRFSLLRAAELAALRNAPFFRIAEERLIMFHGSRYWPGTTTPITETYRDRDGRTHTVVHHHYEPGYVEYYTVPEAQLHITLTADPAAPSIPAAYLLHQALAEKIKLSPGIPQHLANLPPVTAPVTIPPPPTPTTQPGALDYQKP